MSDLELIKAARGAATTYFDRREGRLADEGTDEAADSAYFDLVDRQGANLKQEVIFRLAFAEALRSLGL